MRRTARLEIVGFRWFIGLGALLLISACANDSEFLTHAPPDATLARTASMNRAEGKMSRGVEDRFLEIEVVVPGFGGFYQDTVSGDMVAYVTNATESDNARRLVDAFVSENGVRPSE